LHRLHLRGSCLLARILSLALALALAHAHAHALALGTWHFALGTWHLRVRVCKDQGAKRMDARGPLGKVVASAGNVVRVRAIRGDP
jgi:hypothetical protein